MIWRKLADADPNVTEFQSGLAAYHHNLGSLLGMTGKPAESLKALQAALPIFQKLADANPADTGYQRDLARSHNSVGNLLGDTGKPALALRALQSALTIRQKLADANPTDTGFQNELAHSHNNIGNLLSRTGKPAEALKAHELALAIKQRLADANPSVTAFQSSLAASHNNIGDVLGIAGKSAEALKAHERALAIRQKLADANPSIIGFQSDVAKSHNHVGYLLSIQGKPAEALKSFNSALSILRKLAEANPTVTEFQTGLALSHNNVGSMLGEIEPVAALKSFESALAICQKLVREHPESPDFPSTLGMSLHNLAELDLNAKRYEEARVRLREAVKWQRKALAINPAEPTYRRFLASHLTILISAARRLGDPQGVAEAERELANLRDSDPAMKSIDARLAAIIKGDQTPKDNSYRLRLARRAYDKALHTTATRLWAEALEANPRLGDNPQAGHRYSAACAAALAGCGKGKDDPPPDDASRVKLRRHALGWLEAELDAWSKILESGPPQARQSAASTLKHWKEDPDLVGIRDEDSLAKLPDQERAVFEQLWKEVDGLLAKVEGRK